MPHASATIGGKSGRGEVDRGQTRIRPRAIKLQQTGVSLSAAGRDHNNKGFSVWLAGGRPIPLEPRPRLMGVVNVTPDSFSDGGMFRDPQAALDRALELADEGADILDLGGESTRPGADPVTASEELRRVLPVIEGLAARTTLPLSIDTT